MRFRINLFYTLWITGSLIVAMAMGVVALTVMDLLQFTGETSTNYTDSPRRNRLTKRPPPSSHRPKTNPFNTTNPLDKQFQNPSNSSPPSNHPKPKPTLEPPKKKTKLTKYDYLNFFIQNGFDQEQAEKMIRLMSLSELEAFRKKLEKQKKERPSLGGKNSKGWKKWKSDPEAAFYELEANRPHWKSALSYIAEKLPHRLYELRPRILDTMPDKLRGGEMYLSIIYLLYQRKLALTKGEQRILRQQGWIHEGQKLEELRKDKSGNTILKELSGFSQARYFWPALEKFQQFPHRYREIRKVVDKLPPREHGSPQHIALLRLLILDGRKVTQVEAELVRKFGKYPTRKEKELHQKRVKENLSGGDG